MTLIYKDKELTFDELKKIMQKKRYGKKIEVELPYELFSFKINGVLYDSEYIEQMAGKTVPLRPKLNNISMLACPICGHDIYQVDRYCSVCAQRLNWR